MKRKRLIIIVHIMMITQTYFFLPLIPVYAKQFGVAQYLIGQLIFFYNLPMGFLKIYIGYLIDKIGSKKILLVINILFVIGILFYFNPSSFYMLAIGQFISGISRASFMAATSFYFSEMDEDKRGRNLGIRTAGTGIGFFVGPLIGGFISDYFGYYYIFYILIITLILTFLIILKLPPIKVKRKNERKITPA